MPGLPYDGTPPPEEQLPIEPDALDRPLGEYTEPSALDRPLDEYNPTREVPEHVQSLMGRMSKGKVYLLEESPAVVVLNDGERIRKDPRLAELAATLDAQDPTVWLEAVSAGASSPILHQVLWIQSDLIKHLSTSKVFSWATGLGAGVMGIEWLNDTTLELLFPSPASALLGLSLLAKAGFDPSEGDDPLLERSAHSFPFSLLPTESKEGVELLSSGSGAGEGEIRRKGRGAFTGGMAADLPSDNDVTGPGGGSQLGQDADTWNLKHGIDPNARIAIRYATEADKALRQQAKQSEWYKRNGRQAGKERSTQTRRFGDEGNDRGGDGWSFRDREESGGGRDFAKRISRERRTPYDRRGGGGERGGRRDQSDLDRELDGMMRRRMGQEEGGDLDVDLDVEMGDDRQQRRRGGGGGGRGRGGQRRERRGVDDLDKELDDLFAARTAER